MTTNCLICGFPELVDNYRDVHEICPCCGFQYGYTDTALVPGYTYEQWREKWIIEGMQWFSRGMQPKYNWNPVQQLESIGIRLPKK